MTERSAKQVKGRKSAAVKGGGRQETIEAEAGRHSRSTRGRIEAKATPSRSQSSRAKGTSSRGSGKAKKGESRVVSIGKRASRSERRKAS